MRSKVQNVWMVLILILCLTAHIDILAQTPTIPYGTNNSYTYGLMQSYQTNALADANATSWYSYWKTNFTKDCGGGKTIAINDYSASNAYSEGQGYGLLLAAYAGDKTLYDALWKGYITNVNGNGVMNWTVNCSGSVSANGATDGDLDAAMSLLIANYQWPGTTSPYNYATAATTLINNIKAKEFVTGCTSGLTVQKPGDAFASGCGCTNPSYFATGYYRAFAKHVTADAAFWNKAADDALTLLTTATNSTTGLNPAWTNDAGSLTIGTTNCGGIAAGGGGAATDYQFDAARTPWRIVIDYLWWGTPAAKTYLDKITTWANGKGVSNIVAGYTTAGSANVSYKNSAFTGAFTIGMMANTTNTNLNTFYNWWVNNSNVSGSAGTQLDDKPYFQNALRTMYSFVASGNFWNPYNATCTQPDLGPDLSTCGGGTTLPKSLFSEASTPSGVTYKWYIAGNATVQGTGRTYSATTANTYVLQRDSTGGCTHNDTIVISSSLAVPSLGSDPAALCTATSYNLTPSNAAAFPGTTTWQWAVDYSGGTTYTNITGQTTTTLSNVRKAGRYKLTASISGCSSTSDDVVITSNLPTPVDACISSAGNVALSIANPGLNGTNYNWYTTAGGSTLATVVSGSASNTTSITVHATATTTYYVQDMSAINTNVGPTTLIGTSTDYAPSVNYQLAFTANQNFTINSLQIPFKVYSSNNATVAIEIVDGSGNAFATPKIFTSNPVAVTSAMSDALITFPFTGFNVLSSWGPNLRMRISAVTNIGDPLWSNGTSAYPYNSAGSVVSITGIAGGPGGASTYNYFYNWNISTGAACNRLPVVVTVAAGCSAPAPVNLINFYAVNNKDNVLLSWATASEQNNDYFDVERSVNGTDFTKIGKVKGAGNSTGATVYSFNDYETPFGKIYYRLAQYDFDGTLTYSKIIVVNNENPVTVYVAPNPFSTETDIEVSSLSSEKADIKVMDLTGRIVYQTSVNTNQKISVGNTLETGVYLVQIFLQDSVQNFRIIKQ